MLVPFIAWLLTRNECGLRKNIFWFHISAAALLLTYIFLAGAAPILPQVLLALVLLLALSATLGTRSLRSSIPSLAVSGLVSLLILGPKILATTSFMLFNPRNQELLPQFATWQDSLHHGLRIIIGPTRNTDELRETLVNNTTTGLWHGFEYGLTVAPIVLIILFAITAFLHRGRLPANAVANRIAIGPLFLLIFLAALPFLINVDIGQGFSRFIRSLPLIGSTTNFFRWFIIPMTLIAMLCGLLAHSILMQSKSRALFGGLLASACTFTVMFHYGYLIKDSVDSRPYRYSNTTIERAFEQLRHTKKHQIKAIGDRTDLARNESFLFGESAKYCYEAALGYRLQGMKHDLFVGKIDLVIDDQLNMFNPSCYVYPHENNCIPGSRFDPSNRDAMLDFASYRPLTFNEPRLHQSLTYLSKITILVTLLLMLQPLFIRVRTLLWSPDQGRTTP
jgi:hypothetical protein